MFRFEQEEEKKRKFIYDSARLFAGIKNGPLVTRVFPKKQGYGQFFYGMSQPTLFIPFGKRLGTEDRHVSQEYIDDHYAKATLAAAIASIPAQLLYDIFWSVAYCLIAVPSLIGSIGYAIHAGCTGSYDSAGTAETLLGNVLCAPYFILSIGIDLCREVLALATRTYATITESEEGRAQDYWVCDHQQFATTP